MLVYWLQVHFYHQQSTTREKEPVETQRPSQTQWWSFPSTLRWQILQFLFKQWSVGSYLDTFFGVHLCAFPNSNPTSPPHLIFLCVLLESSASCKLLCLPRPRPPTPDFPWWCNQCSHLLLFITHHQETIFGRSQNSPTSFTSYR